MPHHGPLTFLLRFRLSVRTHPGGLKRLAPKFLLCSEKSTELLGRSTDDGRERFGLKCGTSLRIHEDLVHRTVEFINMAAGVPVGATIPNHAPSLRPPRSTPLSQNVGTSENSATRCRPVTARARSFPDCTCGAEALRPRNMIGTWPATRSAIAGPAPR
jgi:hypothetical protein